MVQGCARQCACCTSVAANKDWWQTARLCQKIEGERERESSDQCSALMAACLCVIVGWCARACMCPPCCAGVTSLAFSVRSPHMLAVGMHDGTVAVFDVRSRRTTPAHASTAANGKHADPVWQVRWIDPGSDREEQLVSISTDGRVKAWTVDKGLEHVTLITLKRIPHRLVGSAGGTAGGHLQAAAGSGSAKASALLAPVTALRGDAQISRNTGGMSFDFSPVDRRMYLAGASWAAGA